MWASLRVLGIESTCDETAAAVVEADSRGRGKILSNCVLSQIAEHAAFGGVVPEIAARAHVEALDPLIRRALAEADCRIEDLDAIAAAAGPGLIGGVMVGLTTGKAIALAAQKPFIAVNHLEAHALTPRLTEAIEFPYLLLLVSGGHSQLVAVHGVGDYQRLGSTVDDAVGEAFDKAAKLLGLPYPGGPRVEQTALGGDPSRFDLPRPMAGPAQSRLFLLRPQDGGAAGGGTNRAPDPDRCRRSLRLVPGGGRGRDRGPLPRRAAPARRFAHARQRRWSRRAASPPMARSAGRSAGSAPKPGCGWPCRRRTCARTMAR